MVQGGLRAVIVAPSGVWFESLPGGVVFLCPHTDSVGIRDDDRNTNGVMGELTKRALGILSPPLRQVARAVGVSYDTMKGWSAGRTDPSPDNRRALAAYMRSPHERQKTAS